MMGWWGVLLSIVIGVPLFFWIYPRRLAALTGPWIANELSQND
jgi:hypothetical protein